MLTGGRRLKIHLQRRRLKQRLRPLARSSASEVIGALAFAAMSLGFFARDFGGSATSAAAILTLPFAGVALLGIWTSRITSVAKILWSMPPIAFVIPFLPIG